MNAELLDSIDKIYERYGYEIKTHHRGARVYIFTKSIYNGADILRTGTQAEVDCLKKDYSEQGYAVKIKEYKSVKETETDLFRDFFKADGVLASLKKRYDNFVDRLMDKLPEHAQYQYINSPYELTLFSELGKISKTQSYAGSDQENSIVEKVVDILQQHNGPLFIVIEAAAGYGKTCTAYEILNKFLNISSEKLPFFTELSRDRKASIFKHILLNEIEEQFSRSITSDVVIHEIKSGRIPLIIDGFDELISKDFSFSATEFQQVESMLSTLVDLLSDNAKIIVTSRKTAIFNSDEFYQWMESKNINYSFLRITISEPTIDNWLDQERLQIIDEARVPIQQFSNPVLLTYLRYINVTDLKKIVVEKKSVVDEYINFLLDREQIRQGLTIDPETQLRIFRKIVRLFTEYDIKSTSKADIKDFILDYNKEILEEAIKKYPSEKRPNISQLADTLTNHAFLDRKDSRNIGFVNEFILGTLIGQNLIMGKYEQHRTKFYEELSQSFSILALQSFSVLQSEKKQKLWDMFNKYPFKYDPQFFFKSDIDLINKTEKIYSHATFTDFNLNKITFSLDKQFSESIFTNCIFHDCVFNPESFSKTTFVSCKFYDCSFSNGQYSCHIDNITFWGCLSNNEFSVTIHHENENVVNHVNYEKLILDMYFKKGTQRVRHRSISQIRDDLQEYNAKDIDKAIHKLEVEEKIVISGNFSFISQFGGTYYRETYVN